MFEIKIQDLLSYKADLIYIINRIEKNDDKNSILDDLEDIVLKLENDIDLLKLD